ncbi:MAG: sugar ABC transporter ATP-binding protein [Rhizobiaceae bacterium]|nr:sugar ABC transporter ATP-binding protein [Rhizobiaceae bacterium]
MSEAGHPRLAIRGLTKSFGGVRALSRADLTIMPGEIHGLLGKNGSGKSTLIKILSGFHKPDEGTLEVDGTPVALPIPLGRSEAIGLSFVHQNLGLLPEATVLENLIAGDHERIRPWFIDWSAEAARARRLFADHNLDLDPWAVVADLSPVKRAQLAIVRAADRVKAHNASASPGLLVLDEPTPFLPIEDVRELFAMMRALKRSGVSIVFVSHDIDEVMEITDRATVLRDGEVIGTFETATSDRGRIVEAIVGRSLAQGRLVSDAVAAPPAISVRGLKGRMLQALDFDVAPGEILGLTGLIGSGYDEVPHLLAGAQPAKAGQLEIDGRVRDLVGLEPTAAIEAGLVFIPADRQKQGLALDLTLTENAMLPLAAGGRGRFWLDHGQREATTMDLIRRFVVKAQAPRQAASELSGGNQQKLLLGKWLQLVPKLILLDEPTQGIDVGARREIYDRLFEACARGAAIICATSEFEQLEMIAHRVLVFERGRVKAELRGSAVTKSSIEQACYGETKVHEPF